MRLNARLITAGAGWKQVWSQSLERRLGDVPGVNLQILIGQMVNLLKDGQPLRISFSNVSVKLKGSDTWVDAQ